MAELALAAGLRRVAGAGLDGEAEPHLFDGLLQIARHVYGGYFGAFLFAGALLALGTWVSSLTRHQILAAVITAAFGVAFIGMFELSTKFGSFFGPVLEQLSIVTHYQAMGRGVVDMRDVYYFLSFALFFLYVNTQTVENRRYR